MQPQATSVFPTRKTFSSTVLPATDRVLGALLGLAVGDALGATLDFIEPESPPFPELARGPHVDVIGGGPFRLARGQVTSGTQMACCLATSIRARGRLEVHDVAARYTAWQEHAFHIDEPTAAALNAIREGMPIGIVGSRQVLGVSPRRIADHGSLARTAPIGVLLACEPSTRRAASLADSSLTHPDPRSRLACAAFNAALSRGVLGFATPHALLTAAREELRHAAHTLFYEGEEELATAVEELEQDLTAAEQDDPELYGPSLHIHRTARSVSVALRLAFWEILHAPSFRDALIDAVNRGGEAHTNGAITGALAGALWGASAIPEEWRRAVVGAVPLEDGPLRSLYHPVALLQ